MPRVSEAEKKKSHIRILEAAAQLMREKGIEATSVSEVMSVAGLTHGGFYRHFESKDALADAAFRHAVDEVVADVEKSPFGNQRVQARDQYIRQYLSDMHVNARGAGCPLAAMATEAGRFESSVQEAAADAVWRMAGLLEAVDTDQSHERVDQGIATMALLLGTITLARLMDSPSAAEDILSAGQKGLAALRPEVFE